MPSDITINNKKDTVTITLHGMRKIAAMKSSVTFRISHIVSVSKAHHDVEQRFNTIVDINHLRIMGSGVSNHYYGGTFMNMSAHPHEKEFWDVDEPEKCIVITLDHESFKRIYISTGDADKTIRRIQSIIKQNRKS